MNRTFQTLALLLTFLFSCEHLAAQATSDWRGPHDYYRATAGAQHDLLANVEKYHLPQGKEKLAQNRLRYALEDFDFILRYFPNHPQALMLMAQTVEKMHKPQMADSYFLKAIQLFPDQAATYGLYGVHRHRSGDIEGAIENYRQALELSPDFAEAHYNLGLAYFSQQKYELANRHAQKAYSLGYPLPALKDKLSKIGRWQPQGR